MNFSKLKLNEGVAVSNGTQLSFDASNTSGENAKNSVENRSQRNLNVKTDQQKRSSQPSAARTQSNTLMNSVDHLEKIRSEKEYIRLLESQKADWRRDLQEKAIDGQERENHPFVTVMPTGDENLIQALKQMKGEVDKKKQEMTTEEASDSAKDARMSKGGLDGNNKYNKPPAKKSSNKELGIRDFTDKEREDRYKAFLKHNKKRLKGIGEEIDTEDDEILEEGKKKCKDGYKYDKKKKKCVKKKSSSSKSSKTVVYVRGPRYFGGGGHHHHHDDDKPSGGDNNTDGGDTGGTAGDGGVSEMFDVLGNLMLEDLTN